MQSRGPNFHSTTSHFQVIGQFWENCIKSPHNGLTHIKENNTFVHTTYHATQLKANFSPVLLYDEPFSRYGPILSKMHGMAPKLLRYDWCQNTHVHIPVCTSYTFPKVHIFFRFVLPWVLFQLWPKFEKSARNDQEAHGSCHSRSACGA